MDNLEVEAAAIVVDRLATKNKSVKSSAGDAKPKKATAKKPPSHPPFYEKEKSRASQYAIQKFTEEKHKQLPLNFRKQLLTQLKKFVASRKLVKVKNSYKLPSTMKAVAAQKSATKKSSVATKLKATAIAKKVVSKAVTKPQTVTKAKIAAKPKSVATKPKEATLKRKDVKPKAKPVKVGKKSTASSLSAKQVQVKVAKKVTAKPKKVKRLSFVKSPVMRISARKIGK